MNVEAMRNWKIPTLLPKRIVQILHAKTNVSSKNYKRLQKDHDNQTLIPKNGIATVQEW